MLAVAATTRSLLVAWLPLALVPLFAPLIHAQDPTTVSVFLPGYKGEEMWSQLRGSIVSSNDVETLYTIFCAPDPPPTQTGSHSSTECSIEGGDLIPFTFYEGPSTLHLGASAESSFTLSIGCDLTGTTAATCSGTTSLASDFTYRDDGLHGPVDTTLSPYALTGVESFWATLTLAEAPLTSIVSGTKTVTYYPSETETAASGATPTSEGSATETGTGSMTGSGSGSGTVVVTESVTTTASVSSSGSGSASESASGSSTDAAASASTTPSGAMKLILGNGLVASLLVTLVSSLL
ncbi:hypothetical protein F4819DRAFT_463918 [Hypoxylon fuscum]|nr:hypothetical protein F4819DRAFT_463918 [Hypoxylon fuscum]